MSIDSAQNQVQAWIESTTGERFSGSFADSLRNGVTLCNFINALRPNTILTINKYNAAFRQMQNIDNFLTVVGKLGVADSDRFRAEDLFYENNIPKVVLTLVAFANAARDKFPNNVDASGLDELRSYASSSHKTDGKVRVVDSGLSIFETGMKKAQTEASNVNRTNDRLVKKDMQEHQSSHELGFTESDMVTKQIMITNAKRSGQDLIIRSKETAVASSDLGMIDQGHLGHQIMISDAKGRKMDNIIRTKDQAVVTGELAFAEADRQSKQAMISDAKGRHMDNIIRSKDEHVISNELAFAEADRQSKQAMISDARGRHMDNIIRTKDKGAISSDLGLLDSNASAHQRLISEANEERLDHIIKQGDVGSDDISYDD